jgi:hypothetical protein
MIWLKLGASTCFIHLLYLLQRGKRQVEVKEVSSRLLEGAFMKDLPERSFGR